jgi:hypothetical protein
MFCAFLFVLPVPQLPYAVESCYWGLAAPPSSRAPCTPRLAAGPRALRRRVGAERGLIGGRGRRAVASGKSPDTRAVRAATQVETPPPLQKGRGPLVVRQSHAAGPPFGGQTEWGLLPAAYARLLLLGFSHHPFFCACRFVPPLVALRAPRAARRGMGAWRAVMRPRARACWGSVAFLWGLGRTPPLHLLFAGPRSFPVRPSRPRNPRVTEWRPTRALHYPPPPLVPSPNSPSTSPASSSATSSSWPARARPRARRPAPARARGTP